MDQGSVEDRLKRIISQRLADAELQLPSDASFDEDLTADSLELVELIMSLEEDFGIDLSDDGWLRGSGVPRRGPSPQGSGTIELPLPTMEGDTEVPGP